MPQHHDTTHDHAHNDGTDGTDGDLAELLDLDGRVLHSYWTDALTWATGALAGGECERILDLGAGTGTGTIALAQRFPEAWVIAVDNSAAMVARIRAKATSLGLGPRVLAHVFAATRPGGVVALAEFAEPLRFLPADLGFGLAGLETRCLDALGQEHARALPDLGSAWSPRLAAAGFSDLDERVFTIELNARSSAAIDYARGWLRRLRSATAHRLDPRDRESLDELLDGGGLESLQRSDELTVRGTRTVTRGRRPRD